MKKWRIISEISQNFGFSIDFTKLNIYTLLSVEKRVRQRTDRWKQSKTAVQSEDTYVTEK